MKKKNDLTLELLLMTNLGQDSERLIKVRYDHMSDYIIIRDDEDIDFVIDPKDLTNIISELTQMKECLNFLGIETAYRD